MNKTFLFSLLVMMCGAMLVCCSGHNEVNLNEEPQDATVELPPSPCVMYMGDCGDEPNFSQPLGVVARVADDEPSEDWEDEFPRLIEKIQIAPMGENQLRIVWSKINQCCPKEVTWATMDSTTIELFFQDTASWIAMCECVFPLYFDFDSLAYGPYTIIADSVEHHIDFQPDMEMYEYVYREMLY